MLIATESMRPADRLKENVDVARTKLSTRFLEDYLLAENRLGEVAREFDKDHVEYWYYTVLALQNSARREDQNALKGWIEKLKNSSFVDNEGIKSLLLRQAMSDKSMADMLERTEELLRKRDIDEIEEKVAPPPELKSTYNPPSSKQMVEDAVKDGVRIADTFTFEATPDLARLATTADFSAEQINDILELVSEEPPDQHHLITLLVKDLRNCGQGWGKRKIHNRLTVSQMDMVLQNQPALIDDKAFCESYAIKLRGTAVPLHGDRVQALSEYLKKLYQFSLKVNKLYSFKGLVAFNYLTFLEANYEQYNRQVMEQYLKIPKAAAWMANPASAGSGQKNDYTIPGIPELAPVVDDESFIRRALRYFYSTSDKAGNWKNLNQDWALALWAEEALLAGRGNERFQLAQKGTIDKFHYNGYTRDLMKRKILELTPMNRKYYKVDEEVELDLWLKNMPSVVVNVYMVCAEAYYVQNLKEVPNSLNLAGCEPFESFDVAYDDRNEMALIKERVKIPSLSGKAGLFIIDILGGDIGVRAIIRKGMLHFIERQVDEGYRFKVMNEEFEELKDGKVNVLGNWYYPDDTGEILVPFADETNLSEPIVVSTNSNSSVALLATFDRKHKNWELVCGFYVEREHMLAKKMAKVVMRPNLFVNEFAVSMKHLANTTLTVTTTDNVGAQTTRVVEVQLSDTEECVSEFLIPVSMRSVECVLKGEIEGCKVHSRQCFEINEMDNGSCIADMFMYTAGSAGYVISVQGKNGEAYANEELHLFIEHRMFQEPLEVKLKSDHNGNVYLGKLNDVRSVTCKPCNHVVFGVQKWNVLIDRVNVPPVMCANEGDLIMIPWLSRPQSPPRIKIYDEAFAKCYDDAPSYKQGYIRVKNLPPGDYKCYIRDKMAAEVSLHIQKGTQTQLSGNDFCMGADKSLELSEAVPLNICTISGNRKDGYKLRLDGCNEGTRLHCFAVSNIPRYTPFSLLAAPNTHPEVNGWAPKPSRYTAAHTIAADSAYVLNRKTPKAVPNMMTVPSVTSGPWAPGGGVKPPPPLEREPSVQELDTGRVRVYEKGFIDVYGTDLKKLHDTSNLEFLSETARSNPNLKPDKDGMVQIPPNFYTEQHRLLYFVAVDDDNTVLRHVIMDESEQATVTNDCTLSPGLPVAEHYMERRRCMCLMPGDELRIEDILTSEFEPFEGIDELFYLFRALKSQESQEAKEELAQFEWLVCWESLSDAEKLAKWEQYQCNEINFFLYQKDKQFFNTVVVPAIGSKLQKSFMDQYLLGSELDAWIKLDLLQTLNTFERILLAAELGGQWATNCCQNIAVEADLVPDPPQENDRRILLALKSRQLSQDLMDASMERPKQAAKDMGDVKEGDVVADQTIAGLDISFGADEVKQNDVSGDDGPADLTMVHEERWYYNVALKDQTKDLITANKFWSDYANYLCGIVRSRGRFLSEHAIKCTKNLSEMLLVLAVTDLPFSAESPKMTELPATASRRPATLIAGNPVMIFLKEIAPSTVRTSSFSISTNYFDPSNKTEVVDGKTVDKFLLPKDYTFKAGKVYGCRAVITNVSSYTATVELLMQIPGGSIPVNGSVGDSGFRTKNFVVGIPAFATHKKEYYFYWPAAGTFEHWPAHICKNGYSVGLSNMATTVTVAMNPPEFHDNYRELCEDGDDKEVLDYLAQAATPKRKGGLGNLWQLDLTKLRNVCSKSMDLWSDVCKFLASKNIYVKELWSLSLKFAKKGDAQPMLGEYLNNNPDFRPFCGPKLDNGVVNYDGYDYRDFQYTQLTPMLNQRVETTQALPDILKNNYRAFLDRMCMSSSAISSSALADKAALCCYLLQQQRYDKAAEAFKAINPSQARKEFAETYDYMGAYVALTMNDPGTAWKLAQPHVKNENLPPQIKAKWQAICDQCQESKNISTADQTFIPERIAAEPPMYDIECLKHKLRIKHNKSAKGPVMLEFWIMDLEMLFSAAPFGENMNSYKYVQPNKTMKQTLTQGTQTTVNIPEDLRNCNSIIRLSWGDPDKNVVVNDYDNEIDVQIAKPIGEVRVVSTEERSAGQPVKGAYCKVYSKNSDGTEQFYKDGYTDIRGRFNYRDISNSDQNSAVKYALLVTTDLGSCKLEIDA